MIRLLAFDLDGTLLRSDGTLSERTISALRECLRRDMHVVLVTARPPRAVVDIARQAGLEGVAICQNKALTIDATSGAILDRSAIPPEIAAPLITRLRVRLPRSAFAAEAGPTFRHEAHYESRYPFPVDAEIATADALADDRLTKLLVRDPGRGFEELLAVVREEVGGHATVSFSDTAFVDITALGVTKLSALERVVRSFGLTAVDVMAFGDMPIDLPMLLWAARGIAMANSHPDVLAAVASHALSNDEDGVAVALVREGVIPATP